MPITPATFELGARIKKKFPESSPCPTFNKIRVNDIFKKSFVSRATFYRLFDSIADVLAYECNKIFAERMKVAENTTFANKTERAVYSATIWLSRPLLCKAIVDNNLYFILYETHRRNADLLKRIYNVSLPDKGKTDYFTSTLSSMICEFLSVYYEHGAAEQVEDVYKTVCQCIDIIANAFLET